MDVFLEIWIISGSIGTVWKRGHFKIRFETTRSNFLKKKKI